MITAKKVPRGSPSTLSSTQVNVSTNRGASGTSPQASTSVEIESNIFGPSVFYRTANVTTPLVSSPGAGHGKAGGSGGSPPSGGTTTRHRPMNL